MNPLVKVLLEEATDVALNVIEKSLPKNAADDQREKDLENIAVLGGANE